MVLRVVEGAIQSQGTVSGTDATTIGLTEETHAIRIFLENPVTIFEGPFTVINATASGSGVTIQGAGETSVTTTDDIITISGTDHITNTDTVSNALVGADGITVTSGVSEDTIAGFRTEFVNASGTLSSEIDSDISTHTADSSAHHAKYLDSEAIAATESARFTMSGTLSTEIDSDISTHTAITDAHHAKYTDAEAITTLEPTTSALAASGVATDANVTINIADIAALTTSGDGHLSNLIEDLTPQLGGDLDVNGKSITSAGNTDINIRPAGTGGIELFTGLMSGNAASREIWLSTSGAGDITIETISNSNTGDIFIQAGGDMTLETFNVGLFSIISDGFMDITAEKRVKIVSSTQDIRLEAAVEVSSTAPLRFDASSSAATPAYSFLGNTNTGMYRIAANRLGLSAGGKETLTVSGTLTSVSTFGVGVEGNLTVTGTVTSDVGTFDTGLTVSGIPVNIGAGAAAGVDSLNSLTGALTLLDAGSVTITDDGSSNITISGAAASVAGADHSTLANLDFASAGHTGFGSSADTSALAASGVATDANVTTNTGDIAALTTSGVAQDVLITADAAELLTVSGNLQTQIDAVESSDVDALTVSGLADITGTIDFVGSNGINVSAAGNTITFDGEGIEVGGGGGGGNIDDINAETGPSITITGTTGVNTITTANTITLTSEDSEIDHDALLNFRAEEHFEESALTGSDGITIVSGTGDVDVAGFRTEFVATSGSLQTQIDAVESSDVDSVNAQIGAITITGTTGVNTSTAGGVITLTSEDSEIDHDALLNFEGTEHFTEASIDHVNIQNIGTKTHAQLDSHLESTDLHFALTGSDGITIVSGTGDVDVAAFRTEFVATSGSLQSQIPTTRTKNIAVEDPTSSEDISWFFTPIAITVTEVTAVDVGTSPSVTISVMHNTNRSSAGNNVLTAATAITNTTTGQNPAIGGDVTVPADSFVWLETSAQSGTVDILLVSLTYTED